MRRMRRSSSHKIPTMMKKSFKVSKAVMMKEDVQDHGPEADQVQDRDLGQDLGQGHEAAAKAEAGLVAAVVVDPEAKVAVAASLGAGHDQAAEVGLEVGHGQGHAVVVAVTA